MNEIGVCSIGGMTLAGENPKKSEKYLSHYHLVHHKFQIKLTGSNPDLRIQVLATNHMSHKLQWLFDTASDSTQNKYGSKLEIVNKTDKPDVGHM